MNEKKITRVCWNTNGWKKPSGMQGKSKSLNANEKIVGYGHEEWIFDFGKIINGFHYAYLQAIAAHRNKYIENIFDISLYSINSDTKMRYMICEIKNVHVVPSEESLEVFQLYKRKKWYNEMIGQLKAVNAFYKQLENDPEYFATIKFKIKDVKIFKPPTLISSDDSVVKLNRYMLYNYPS